MYILQQSLFTFEEWLKIDNEDRLDLLFSTIDLEPFASKLRSSSPKGAQGHDRTAIFRALLAAPLEGITTFTALHRRLKSDIKFKYQCGFCLAKRVPSVSTFSRVFDSLVSNNSVEELFNVLVQQCLQEEIITGNTIAVDSTAIDAYEKKQPKSKTHKTGNAAWGAKLDTFGNKITWFGYKIHLAVDTKSELPIALKVTPAHINDGDMGPVLIEQAAKQLPETELDYVIMDAGYDQYKNYEAAKKYKAQAIIPLNIRNQKEPPAGFSNSGTPRCSMGYDMAYWGSDGHFLKFRCPHILGKVNCPHGSFWCSSSNYGMVVKVNVNDDLRRFSIPHRDSRKWKELFEKRTSVERCNSRLKEKLTANDLHVRGIEKVTAYVYLNAVVLLASALAIKRQKSIKESSRAA